MQIGSDGWGQGPSKARDRSMEERRIWIGEIEGHLILTLGLDLVQVRGCITSKALLIALLSFFPFV